MKIKNLFLIVAAVCLVTFSSCSKKDSSPDYAGTWTNSTTQLGMTVKAVLTLTEGSYSVSSQLGSGSTFAELGGAKGTLSVSGATMTIKATSVGVLNSTSQKVEWFSEGTTQFKAQYPTTASQTKTCTYKVSGNSITFTYTDGTASQTYTK